jgi:SAM-dependent methyltransferase
VEFYDRIGVGYNATRRADPRLASVIQCALGDARIVLNVGAGSGAYEPTDRQVVAVEPSATMAAQRPSGAARVVSARAESLPFGDGSFDAAMAVLSDHHWADRAAGLRELRRVARQRAVVFTWDQAWLEEFWLPRDYLDDFAALPGMPIDQIAGHLGATSIQPVPIAHDWQDGFFAAFWRRPAAYLDPSIRAGISVFHRLSDAHVADAMRRLADDLASGRWGERNADLIDEYEHDFGYRLLIAEYTGGEPTPGARPLLAQGSHDRLTARETTRWVGEAVAPRTCGCRS